MKAIIEFDLVSMTGSKDSTGQTKTTPTPKTYIGEVKSITQNEYYKADQAGIRPQGIIIMSRFDYDGETQLQIGSDTFTIYRTYQPGIDKIELYYGERVGNNG